MRIRAGVLALLLLAACVTQKPVAEVNPISGGEIAETVLPTVVKKPPEAAPAIPEPAVSEPVEPSVKSPAELACRTDGGRWVMAGRSGAHTCVHATKDGGKSCSRESECDGVCLARSKTCAPVRPLFGCNDILQNDGVMATLCID